MPLIGLTGNIGSGKSTVAQLLREKADIIIFNCDAAAKDIIVNPASRNKINHILGKEVIVSGTPAEFKTMREIIFREPDKKKRIEDFVHPLVWSDVRHLASGHQDKICIIESAIIYETESEEMFDYVITVSCDKAERLKRITTSRGLSQEEAEALMNGQFDSAVLEAWADFIIWTDCSLAELQKRVDDLYKSLLQLERTTS